MRKIVAALMATPLGIAGLGISAVVAKNEIHYWMQPSHLPMLAVAGVTLASAGIGGGVAFAKKKITEHKERSAVEELAEIREALRAKQAQEALPEAPPTLIDLGRVSRQRRAV